MSKTFVETGDLAGALEESSDLAGLNEAMAALRAGQTGHAHALLEDMLAAADALHEERRIDEERQEAWRNAARVASAAGWLA